ncbi:MAG: NADH-ubiquinone oxidoreductase-F iron-sulfur binding region domain-containing protein, partial [Deltaproteobacteria bacterium]|nr:NADH-ubiquinone oxidoreductase-F iron-sulfur binding region domain-containing protein [Deltaproteobacteria bacterium]
MMTQITAQKLNEFREKILSSFVVKEGEFRCMVCAGTGCVACKSLKVRERLEAELKERGLSEKVKVIITGCNGFCAQGPIMVVYPAGIFYEKLTPEEIPNLVEEHFIKGQPAQKFIYTDLKTKQKIPLMENIPFFHHQVLRALRNRSLINAENIEEYIARDGYAGIAKVLSSMKPEEVIEEVKLSGLRGRGGAGFPTGKKWEEGRRYTSFPKYVICNGDEGDPGAFMDRSVLEADPHAVLEGMAICGYATDSHQGYVYVRAEYPLAIQRLNIAIEQAKSYGLLGKDIFGSNFDFDIGIYPGAGAFVCGESTALMYSLEGKRGMPRIKPPRSTEAGLWGQPTVLNNVETFANVPSILLNGSSWFASMGTAGSKGTKVFALTGLVQNVGLIEVPMGTTLRKIVFDIGGGIPDKREYKAVQIGGPSGACLPASLLDTEVDFDSLDEAGAMMGSGGLVVMNDLTCMVDTARFFTDFSVDESCGKCVPCRIGMKVMLNILHRII